MKLLAPTLRKVYGPKVQLFYQYDTVAKDPTSSVTIESSRPSPAVQPHSANPFKTDVVADFDSQLNPRYTFENYCGSISNKIARSIGEAIASNPKCKTFNPLFIFGPTGVGKTHLIQAIGIRIKERNPQSRVLYVSARLFESQYTTAATAKPSRINVDNRRHSGPHAQDGYTECVFPHLQSSASESATDNPVERLCALRDDRYARPTVVTLQVGNDRRT